MFFMSIIILVALTAIFAFTWFDINKTMEVMPFDTKGHYLIILLYFSMQYLFSRIYGALQIGYYKMSDILYSQALTTIIVDILMYAVMSLFRRRLLWLCYVCRSLLSQCGRL